MPNKLQRVQLLTHSQACRYCHRDFVPTRRGTQLYCSESCRITYCRKKKKGTLHRLVQLPGPARPSVPFSDLFLAATAGSLTANTVTQTAEYQLVTKGLREQIAQLQAQLQQQLALNQQQGQLLAQLQLGQLRLLQALGVPPAAQPPAVVAAAVGAAADLADFADFGPIAEPVELPEIPFDPLLLASDPAAAFPPLLWPLADAPPLETVPGEAAPAAPGSPSLPGPGPAARAAGAPR